MVKKTNFVQPINTVSYFTKKKKKIQKGKTIEECDNSLTL